MPKPLRKSFDEWADKYGGMDVLLQLGFREPNSRPVFDAKKSFQLKQEISFSKNLAGSNETPRWRTLTIPENEYVTFTGCRMGKVQGLLLIGDYYGGEVEVPVRKLIQNLGLGATSTITLLKMIYGIELSLLKEGIRNLDPTRPEEFEEKYEGAGAWS